MVSRTSFTPPAIHPSRIQILIADDHDLVRTGIRLLVESIPGCKVCGEATNGIEAVELASRMRPHVAILDLHMPVMNGVEAIREIARASPGTAILGLTGVDSIDLKEQALAAGARAFLLKTGSSNLVIDHVRQVAGMSDPTDAATRTPAPAAHDAARLPRGADISLLTARELQVTRLLAYGRSNWAVGEILGISSKTVETHRANIMRKVGAGSIVELVHYAVRNQIVAP